MAGSSKDDETRSGTLLDLEALDCPICREVLTVPVFQCDNGHIACSTCCNKLRNLCHSCSLSIGKIRCIAMERVIEGVIVSCQNNKLGCTKSLSYGNDLSTHEEGCVFSLCSCPARYCKYKGTYKEVYSHFKSHKSKTEDGHQFSFGESRVIYVEFDELSRFAHYTAVVMDEYRSGLLFVVECFKEPYGVCVTVSCIAPSSKEVGEFSCLLSTTDMYNMTIYFPEIKRILKASLNTPPRYDFMVLPSYVFCGRKPFPLRICVSKVQA